MEYCSKFNKNSWETIGIVAYLLSLRIIQYFEIMERDLNRLKVVLAEKKKTNKWLAEQLGKDPATVSKWCTNAAQPGLDTLYKIAELFDMDIRELINPTKVKEPRVVYMVNGSLPQ